MKHDAVILLSGGVGSFWAAKRYLESAASSDAVMLFTDTLIEDDDLYRFLDDVTPVLGCRLVRISDGRTPWQVFRDRRFIGNTRADVCSRVLKRELAREWIDEHVIPGGDVVVGIDWTEVHRLERMAPRWDPYRVVAPLTEPPYLDKPEQISGLAALGLEPPRLYALGFSHNNCGGFCVKQGQGAFVNLLRQLPARFAEHEAQEEQFREFIGRDVAILRDRRDGKTRPLPLAELRRRHEAGGEQLALIDLADWGGCGCMVD